MGHANAARLSACPFRGCRTARCLLHTPLHLCRQLEGWSLVSRSHTCSRVCASNVCTLVLPHLRLFLQALSSTFPPSVCPPLSFSPYSPLLQHTFVLFSLPLFLLPSLFFSHNFSFLLCPACSDCGWGASRERAQGDAADATAVWAPCLLLGPLRRTRLHVS